MFVDMQAWRDLALQPQSALIARVLPGGYVVPDTNTPPIITLLGPNPMAVALGTAYVEPGATATNKYGDPLTQTIVISGSVNTNVAGTYILTYTAQDAVGNSASETREVHVAPNGGGSQTPAPSPTPSPAGEPTPPPTGEPTPTPTPGSTPDAPSPSPTPSGSPSPEPVPADDQPPSSPGTDYFPPVEFFNPNGPSSPNSGGSGADNSSDIASGSGHINSNGSTVGYAIAVMLNGIDTPRSVAAGAVDAGLGWSGSQLDETARAYKKAASGSASTTQEAKAQSLVVATALGLTAAAAIVVLVPLHFVLEYPVVFYPLSGGLFGYLLFYLYGMFIAGKAIAKPMAGPRDTFS